MHTSRYAILVAGAAVTLAAANTAFATPAIEIKGPPGRYSIGDLARRAWNEKQRYLRSLQAKRRGPQTQFDLDRLASAATKRPRKAEKLKRIAAAGGMAYS